MNKSKIVEKQYLVPFIIITSLFALWGFANDITNPMVSAFQTIMEISVAKAALVQFAFYGSRNSHSNIVNMVLNLSTAR